MADETDDTDDAFTLLGRNKTIVRTDDDSPSISEMERREDEPEDEFLKRQQNSSRGNEYDRVYLHTSGWVKVVKEDPTGIRGRHGTDEYEERGAPEFEYWYPPRRIELIR